MTKEVIIMSDLVNLISTMGFPVVACLGMAYFFKYVFDKNREDINSLRDVLNNNTLVIQRLVDFLKNEGDNHDE